MRTVATSRPDRELQRLLGESAVILDLKDFAADLERDAAAYVGEQLRAPDTRTRLREAGVDTAELTRAVTERGKSNFLYLRLLFAGGAPLAVDEVPKGLGDVYARSFDDLLARSGLGWRSDARPFAGVLAVAREPLTSTRLCASPASRQAAFRTPLRRSSRFSKSSAAAAARATRTSTGVFRRCWSSRRQPVVLDRRPELSSPDRPLVGRRNLVQRRRLPARACCAPPVSRRSRRVLGAPGARRPGFRAAKNRRFLSDESFLLDLETATEAAEHDGLAGLPRVIALALGSAMLHARLSATPVGAIVALARLGAESEALRGSTASPRRRPCRD